MGKRGLAFPGSG